MNKKIKRILGCVSVALLLAMLVTSCGIRKMVQIISYEREQVENHSHEKFTAYLADKKNCNGESEKRRKQY